jgi:hypothetical protein
LGRLKGTEPGDEQDVADQVGLDEGHPPDHRQGGGNQLIGWNRCPVEPAAPTGIGVTTRGDAERCPAAVAPSTHRARRSPEASTQSSLR